MKRWLKRGALILLAAVLAFAAFAIASGWSAFGKRASGDRLSRMEKSPQWKDGHFENPQPIINDNWRSIKGMFEATEDVAPRSPMPVEKRTAKSFETPVPSPGCASRGWATRPSSWR